MKTTAELREWIRAAMQDLGDPAEAVAQIFVRFQPTPAPADGDIVGSYRDGDLLVNLSGDLDGIIPLELNADGPVIADDHLEAFGVTRIVPTFWYLTPSLNVPGVLHAFVVVYDVPSPAPWESEPLDDGARRLIMNLSS